MLLPRFQNLVAGNFHLFGADVVCLDAGHVGVFKGQDVSNVDGQKAAGGDDGEVRGDGLAQQIAPILKIQARLVGFADEVRRETRNSAQPIPA